MVDNLDPAGTAKLGHKRGDVADGELPQEQARHLRNLARAVAAGEQLPVAGVAQHLGQHDHALRGHDGGTEARPLCQLAQCVQDMATVQLGAVRQRHAQQLQQHHDAAHVADHGDAGWVFVEEQLLQHVRRRDGADDVDVLRRDPGTVKLLAEAVPARRKLVGHRRKYARRLARLMQRVHQRAYQRRKAQADYAVPHRLLLAERVQAAPSDLLQGLGLVGEEPHEGGEHAVLALRGHEVLAVQQPQKRVPSRHAPVL
mmetsp:Transcript_9260/g.23403  ORF Transcript_9260/g.23403 Transcript_9260/m.23403 type:complete len:257 (-) Transcript_9260:822-1592(-)